MESAEALCHPGRAREVRTECVKRITWCRDGLKWRNAAGTRTRLLSGPTGAVTVRRLWTGAEATNVRLIEGRARKAGPGDGTNERLHWSESLVTFRHPF